MKLQHQDTFSENGFQAFPANPEITENGNPHTNSGFPGHVSLKNILPSPKAEPGILTAGRRLTAFPKTNKTDQENNKQNRLDPIPIIDKLAISIPGSVSAPGVYERFERVLDYGGVISLGNDPNYDHSYQLYGELVIQWGAKKGNTDNLRIEWNPANTGIEPIIELATCFPAHKLRYVKVKRSDPAIDYPCHLIPAMFDKPGVKKGGFYGTNGIDTLYLGSHKSETQIRVYDKKLQLKDVKGIDIPEAHRYRVEAQCRFKKDPLVVNLTAGTDKTIIPNPFEGLVYYEPAPGVSSSEWACVVSGCKEHGVIGIRKMCKPKEWVRKHLKQLRKQPTIDPAKTFDLYGQDVYQTYFRELAIGIDKAYHHQGRL